MPVFSASSITAFLYAAIFFMFTSSTKLRAMLSALALAGVVVSLGASAAASESDEPEQLIRSGNELRRKGDDLRAFGYLQRAYDMAHTPRAASQLGLCEQALGRFEEAEPHLSEALSTHDAWVDAKRESLESAREAVRKKLGQVRVAGVPPGATVTAGKRAAHKLNADASLWLVPGPTTLLIEADGFRSATKSVVVALGEEVKVDAGLVPERTATATPAPSTSNGDSLGSASPSVLPPPSTAPAADDRGAWRITGLVAGAAGVVMVVGGVVMRGIASDKLEALDRDAKNGRPYNPANDNWKTFDNAALTLFVAGGAAVVGGAALYLLNRNTESTGPTTAARSNGAVSVAWRTLVLMPTISLGTMSSGIPTAGIVGSF